MVLEGEAVSASMAEMQLDMTALATEVKGSVTKDSTEQVDKAPVKYFTYDYSIKRRLQSFLVGDSRSRFYNTVFDFVIKLTACLLYITRVQLDDTREYECGGHRCENGTTAIPESEEYTMVFSSTRINWYLLLWVHRPFPLWVLEVGLSTVTLIKALITVYVTYKMSPMEKIVEPFFVLELVSSVPMIVTVCWWPLRNLYVPTFLNIWLAKEALESLFHDLHLTKQRFQCIAVTMYQQMLILTATLVCLIITTVCGIQHIQRASQLERLSLFESVWFVIVTFSTVGYGDISPDIWLGQLFMMLMICAAFAFVPRQVEIIASTWIERQKEGGTFSQHRASRTKHVVVCTSTLSADTLMDFLNEFYAHPKLEDHMVVLLSPSELDLTMQTILRDPKWVNRVMYIRGSALKDADLSRCRIQVSEACFILGNRTNVDKDAADQHTILRSWAVKDFAPNCPQYVQIFKPESKIHVKFAEHIVCEDEFKYALLANNCLYPGLSTLVTLLLHTSRGEEGQGAAEKWQQIYGRHSGNEIYHIQLSNSIFFRQYKGWLFTEAAVDSHQRFGVSLVGVEDRRSVDPRLLLNPGSSYILKDSDICFYLSVTEEEYSKIVTDPVVRDKVRAVKEEINHTNMLRSACKVMANHTTKMVENIHFSQTENHRAQMALELQNLNQEEEESGNEYEDDSVFSRSMSDNSLQLSPLAPVIHVTGPEGDECEEGVEDPLLHGQEDSVKDSGTELDRSGDGDGVLNIYPDMGQEGMCTGVPPTSMYIGTKETICHLVADRRQDCCLRWDQTCEHCSYKHARDSRWDNQLIILAAERPSSGIYNFIVPLRSNFLQRELLNPIILLLENEPDPIFLHSISQFPMVYWMLGKITVLDDLLRAGINKAAHIVIVNREGSQVCKENTLADSNTIVAVQTIHKLFPSTSVITELSQSSNMRFMQFRALDEYSWKISKLERTIKNQGSNLSYMFRIPFAAGNVFSACMLDTLLYQTFVKDYLISFVRLLLGIDRVEGSGHLSSIRVKKQTVATFPTYGRLFQSLVLTTGEIPIAIYRTQRGDNPSDRLDEHKLRKNGPLRGPSVKTRRRQATMKKEVVRLVKCRMEILGLPDDDYNDDHRNKTDVSFVIVNPYYRRRLKRGDIVYVIQPSSMCAVQPIDLRRRKTRHCSTETPPTCKKVDLVHLHSVP
ncbi:LOW QUALITY PROTEIN: potassium channel subfamily T member 2-like [Liolophura sinensis]|uniref:LOW QUALITY PROTEIN: potassium channel subfamily T member 2-like n=1 Tax=Liolophura sinensis TaxID=3198878 RepID=UPI003157F8B1